MADKNEIDVGKELEAAARKVEEALAKLPSIEELERQATELEAKREEITKLKNLKYNFGPGKPGKKTFDLPIMPKSLGQITIGNRKLQGKTALNFEEWQEYLFYYSNRIELEEKMRNGESVSQQELRQLQNTAKGVVNIRKTGEQVGF